MTRAFQRRKVAPKVKNGVVQKKHRHRPTATLGYVVDRESPAKGCRHVLSKRDIHTFIGLIPDWSSLAVGLESIVLTRSGSHDGLYETFRRERTSSIQIPAWDGDLWWHVKRAYYEEHRVILERLGVACEALDDGVECRFTLAQARGFLLLHVFLHELGHHVDRMQSKQQREIRRGESFAERYADALSDIVWPEYVRVFGDPRRGASDEQV